ncbi:hypothetical protein D920_00544 [Enterococcus faecalis 13-SD-W-01]|nr:hypothetical protein D920_00544 [Enterococcus faecalis 13-SD-W-01]
MRNFELMPKELVLEHRLSRGREKAVQTQVQKKKGSSVFG